MAYSRRWCRSCAKWRRSCSGSCHPRSWLAAWHAAAARAAAVRPLPDVAEPDEGRPSRTLLAVPSRHRRAPLTWRARGAYDLPLSQPAFVPILVARAQSLLSLGSSAHGVIAARIMEVPAARGIRSSRAASAPQRRRRWILGRSWDRSHACTHQPHRAARHGLTTPTPRGLARLSPLQPRAAPADDTGVSSQPEPTTICESCGQPLDDATMMVIIKTSTGQEIARHRRCHMLELLERA